MVSLCKLNIFGNGRNSRNIERNKRQSNSQTCHNLAVYSRRSKISMTSQIVVAFSGIILVSIICSSPESVLFPSRMIKSDSLSNIWFWLSQDSSVKDQSLAFQPRSTPPESLEIGGKWTHSIHCRIAIYKGQCHSFPQIDFRISGLSPGSNPHNLHWWNGSGSRYWRCCRLRCSGRCQRPRLPGTATGRRVPIEGTALCSWRSGGIGWIGGIGWLMWMVNLVTLPLMCEFWCFKLLLLFLGFTFGPVLKAWTSPCAAAAQPKNQPMPAPVGPISMTLLSRIRSQAQGRTVRWQNKSFPWCVHPENWDGIYI